MPDKLMTVRDEQNLEALMTKVQKLEEELAAYKELEAEYKSVKAELYDAMDKFNVKKWEMPDGTKVTRVEGQEPYEEEVEQFDEGTFKLEEPGMYALYTKRVIKKSNGKKGYVRITPPKE